MALRFSTLTAQRNQRESGAFFHAEQLNGQIEQLSSCYKGEDKTLGQFSGLDESKKADNPALETILGCITAWMRARGAHPILGCFHCG
jgi:hypothetical protein